MTIPSAPFFQRYGFIITLLVLELFQAKLYFSYDRHSTVGASYLQPIIEPKVSESKHPTQSKGPQVRSRGVPQRKSRPKQPQAQQASETTPKEPDRNKPLLYKSPVPPNGKLGIKPVFGEHRPDVDAVLSFSRGFKEGLNSGWNVEGKLYSLGHFITMIGSLQKSGFKGDIVLGVEPFLEKDLYEYLEFQALHNNVIVYEIPLICEKWRMQIHCQVENMYFALDSGVPLRDLRSKRQTTTIRFEYYWAWSTLYSETSRLFLADAQEAFFQLNPFGLLPPSMKKTVIVYEDAGVSTIGNERSNTRWVQQAHPYAFERIKDKNIVFSGTVFAGQPAMLTYTSAMVSMFDESQCLIMGCDQGHQNYLVQDNRLVGAPNIESVIVQKQGHGLVNLLAFLGSRKGALSKIPVEGEGKFIFTKGAVWNYSGSYSPVVYQYSKDQELNTFVSRAQMWLLEQHKKAVTETSSQTETNE